MSEKPLGYHAGELVICDFCFESNMPPDSVIFRGDIDALVFCCDICRLPLGAWEAFYQPWRIDRVEIDPSNAEASQYRERTLVNLITLAVQRKLLKNGANSRTEESCKTNFDTYFGLDLDNIENLWK